jgi:hypothetical protein
MPSLINHRIEGAKAQNPVTCCGCYTKKGVQCSNAITCKVTLQNLRTDKHSDEEADLYLCKQHYKKYCHIDIFDLLHEVDTLNEEAMREDSLHLVYHTPDMSVPQLTNNMASQLVLAPMEAFKDTTTTYECAEHLTGMCPCLHDHHDYLQWNRIMAKGFRDHVSDMAFVGWRHESGWSHGLKTYYGRFEKLYPHEIFFNLYAPLSCDDEDIQYFYPKVGVFENRKKGGFQPGSAYASDNKFVQRLTDGAHDNLRDFIRHYPLCHRDAWGDMVRNGRIYPAFIDWDGEHPRMEVMAKLTHMAEAADVAEKYKNKRKRFEDGPSYPFKRMVTDMSDFVPVSPDWIYDSDEDADDEAELSDSVSV